MKLPAHRLERTWIAFLAGTVCLSDSRVAPGQHVAGSPAGLFSTPHLIVPPSRGFSLDPHVPAVEIRGVDAEVRILEQTASTTLEVQLFNPSPQPLEATLLLPVPDGSVVHSFQFEGAAKEPVVEILRREDARATYQSIVQRLRDPALLEFAGFSWLRSSVFPVPASGSQRIRLTYEHLLERDGARVDYLLPRSEKLDQRVPWRVRVQVLAKDSISAVFSPSHDLETISRQDHAVVLKTAERSFTAPGAFRLSYLTEGESTSASLFAYPDPKVGGGYFLLMCGLPAFERGGRQPEVRRDVVLVLDRSGSMAGGKLDQARTAALQILEGLADGEFFNIVDYSTDVARFSSRSQRKSKESLRAARDYLEALRPSGGTNIHDALLEALRLEPGERTLPMALFLTDGLPTIGQTSESAIRELVEKGNAYGRRVFTFGVGTDVNVPLLDRVAELSRATSTYVLPGQELELAVASVFQRLYGPVLTDASLEVIDSKGAVDPRRVREVMPAELPDYFDGEPFLVLGQYQGEAPLEFRLSGRVFGKERRFAFRFELDSATTKNAFVPRLWASRRIAFLADQIRLAGADPAPGMSTVNLVSADPRFRELTDEIVRLSTEFGILSEYTAFLATEGTDLSQWDGLLAACSHELDGKAWKTRSGAAAINQGLNLNEQKKQSTLNLRNSYVNDKLQRVEISAVQQICDRAFFKRADQWVDAQIVSAQEGWKVDREIAFGSTEHLALVERLVREGRAGVVSMPGEIVLRVDGQTLLIRNP